MEKRTRPILSPVEAFRRREWCNHYAALAKRDPDAVLCEKRRAALKALLFGDR